MGQKWPTLVGNIVKNLLKKKKTWGQFCPTLVFNEILGHFWPCLRRTRVKGDNYYNFFFILKGSTTWAFIIFIVVLSIRCLIFLQAWFKKLQNSFKCDHKETENNPKTRSSNNVKKSA